MIEWIDRHWFVQAQGLQGRGESPKRGQRNGSLSRPDPMVRNILSLRNLCPKLGRVGKKNQKNS